MTTVDLAFADVAAEAGAREVVYWRLWDQSEWLEPPGGSTRNEDGSFTDGDSRITYRSLRGNLSEALDARCLIYWGDFLHMATYQRQNLEVLTRRMRAYSDEAEAAGVVAEHLMLRGRSRADLERVISFGSTLSFNAAGDYAGDYGKDLHQFLSRVHRVWLRDSYSAQVAGVARAPRDELCKGVDAALLLRNNTSGARNQALGVFFGRSALQPEPLARFSQRLTKRLGFRPAWIPWGHEPAFWPMNRRKRFRIAWPALEHEVVDPHISARAMTYVDAVRGRGSGPAAPSADQLLEQLSSCALVVTDTYHLALNAWRVGTPAVCVVDRPGAAWDVNSGGIGGGRDKRTDLYSQLDALPLLVDGTRLWVGAESAVDGVCAYLANTANLNVTHQRLAALTEQSRGMLIGAIRDRLGQGPE